ncbi:hypothetical protein AMELA_G00298160 [Ameiurus melas]|uniref:Uncharacterized protein n=1 Tax=Ameiurus melas TaxID=219545 RepID=A0A7J5ZI13_AMEME|nr:hypothetical protein AMELA_G00298160 [Ameiurus melas]
MMGAAKNTFPNATIHIPMINFSDSLPPITRTNLPQSNVETLGATFKLIRLNIPIQGSANNMVLNLSQTVNLTTTEYDILEKGLSFIPFDGRTAPDYSESACNITEYHRRLKIFAFFEPSDDITAKPPFTTKSDWEPPPRKIPKEVQDLIKLDWKTIKEIPRLKSSHLPNISEEEKRAINSLKQNSNIVIKPADKGSAVVIMDRPQYVQEALRQLNNPEYYKQLAEPIYPKSIPIIRDKITTLLSRGYINQKQAKYLVGESTARPRQFYLLPKIHKPRITWPTPLTPPGRPIVSDCGSESYRIAEFLDHHLNPLSTRHPSYIQDTALRGRGYTRAPSVRSTGTGGGSPD